MKVSCSKTLMVFMKKIRTRMKGQNIGHKMVGNQRKKMKKKEIEKRKGKRKRERRQEVTVAGVGLSWMPG